MVMLNQNEYSLLIDKVTTLRINTLSILSLYAIRKLYSVI
jgi:hypothetical protein